MARDVQQVNRASIADALAAFASRFDQHLAQWLEPDDRVPRELIEAIRYSALAPGKRIRPFLVVRCCELAGGDDDRAWPVAAAVECVHAFSLIHDDLPAMDNDDVRRGQPTCHKKFGEALAILAGDALIMRAFELLVSNVADKSVASRLVAELAEGAGWFGMIGGQARDMRSGDADATKEQIDRTHAAKTAWLIRAACRMGAIVGGGDPTHVEACGRFGEKLGHAFQIADDLLDVTGSSSRVGKGIGKDAGAGKHTYPGCVGIEASRVAARDAMGDAVAALDVFGTDADDLRILAGFVVDRNY